MKIHAIYEDFFDYLLDRVPAADILAYHVADSTVRRAEELRIFKSTGSITDAEREELRQIGEFEVLLAALRAKALARID